MGLDKLNLTIFEPPDTELLEEIGFVSKDEYRNRFYKYFCNLAHTQVMWKPHKFGPELNERMAYTKLDFSPKHFSCFQELMGNLQNYFSTPNVISLDRFTISVTSGLATCLTMVFPLKLFPRFLGIKISRLHKFMFV